MFLFIDARFILTLLRIVLGAVMIYYGWPKIRDLRANAKDFVGMGFKPGWFWGTLIALVEFPGGTLVVLGLFAEIAAAFFAFQMLVGTFWKLKNKKDFTEYSYDLQLFALGLVVWKLGPGAFSLVSVEFPLLRWDVAAGAILFALFLAYLPELFGKPYQRWRG